MKLLRNFFLVLSVGGLMAGTVLAQSSTGQSGAAGVSLGRPRAIAPAIAPGYPTQAIEDTAVQPAGYARPQPVYQAPAAPAPLPTFGRPRLMSGNVQPAGFASHRVAPVPAAAPNTIYDAPVPFQSVVGGPIGAGVPVDGMPLGDGCCFDDGCGMCCDTCCPMDFNAVYFSAEYLAWWTRGDRLPVLATTGPAASQGILGQPGTTVLYGGDDLSPQLQSGARFNLGFWIDPCRQWAIDTSFFFLGQRSQQFMIDSNNLASGVIARPFFSANRGAEFRELVAFPDVANGTLTVQNPSRLWGFDVNVRRPMWCGPRWRFDLLGGFRYLDLNESLYIREIVRSTGADPLVGNAVGIVTDQFSTRNQFVGGQVGANWGLRLGRWSLDLRGRLGLGNTHQTVSVFGNQVIVGPGNQLRTAVGGLYALPSNIGTRSANRFSVVPELGFNVGFQLTDHLRLFAGYNLLYWTNVVRPGEQVDRVLNEQLIPNFTTTAPASTQPRPMAPFRESDFWAQGVNFGIELRY